jgi:hypothetical protein
MTPLGLTVLRRTATLAHAVPGLRVRLRHDGSALLEVLRPAHPVVAPSGRWLTPCAFRVAVGRAVRAQRDGRVLAVLGLPAGVDPAVDVAATSGALLPGGIAQVPTGTGIEIAFATTVRPETVAVFAHADDLDVRCHPDPVTEAALVVFTTAAPAGSPAFEQVHEHARALLARCAVHELMQDRDHFLHGGERPGAAGPALERPQERPPRS